VSVDSSSDDPGRRVVLVGLIYSSDDSGNNSDDDSGGDSEDHEASSETIMHEICPWTFTSSLINCSNASISICCRAHDIDRIWIEINKLKESAEEKQAIF
jgi:hypothetical protein